jgi:hypothetical protein
VGKIYTFVNLVLPILVSLAALQVILLVFKTATRLGVNFFLFSLLAISSIRPNILGESFGLISPLYFFTLVYLSKRLPPEYLPTEKAISRARNSLFAMFFILFFSWTIKAVISSGNGYPFNFWPPIANMLTVGFSCYCLLQIFKLGSILRFFRLFIYLMSFQAFSGLVSRFILNYQYCTDFTAGRGWNYTLCAPGAIFSSQTRLTGISGEPSIFAVYLAVAAIILWWPQLKIGIFLRFFLTGVCIWASMVSGATTGAIVGILALSLIPFQRSTLKHGPALLIFYSVFTYALIQTRIAQSYVEKIFSDKKKSNLGSISDRNLNLGLDDYLNRWSAKPFGSEWGIDGQPYSSGINLLAESLFFGPITIVFMIALVMAANLLSSNPVRTLSSGIVVFFVCLTLQPAWANAIWFFLLYMFLLADLVPDSSLKKFKLNQLINAKN